MYLLITDSVPDTVLGSGYIETGSLSASSSHDYCRRSVKAKTQKGRLCFHEVLRRKIEHGEGIGSKRSGWGYQSRQGGQGRHP